MRRQILSVWFTLTMMLGATAASDLPNRSASVRLLLSEVQPGAMQVQQYCTVVFADRRFHYERASIHNGKDMERKVYEGEFSDSDWNTLGEILDNTAFREVNVPREVAPAITQDAHVYTISVARNAHFQNMEFLDKKSLKPYQTQVKPLLDWWKSFRGRRLVESKVPVDAHCSLNSEHTVFSQ